MLSGANRITRKMIDIAIVSVINWCTDGSLIPSIIFLLKILSWFHTIQRSKLLQHLALSISFF